jgi:hypothetical protein
MWRFLGTENLSLLYGSIALNSSGSPFLLSGSSNVISSPKIDETFPRLISSIIKT